MSRLFANGTGDLGSILGHVIPKTLKMVLDTSLLNTQQYKVCIEGKMEQSSERSSALPYTSVAIEKGTFWLPLTKGRQLYFTHSFPIPLVLLRGWESWVFLTSVSNCCYWGENQDWEADFKVRMRSLSSWKNWQYHKTLLVFHHFVEIPDKNAAAFCNPLLCSQLSDQSKRDQSICLFNNVRS